MAEGTQAHYTLATTLTFRVIEQLVGARLMLHACGLSLDNGRVLALVAPSGTGKTTAARTLATTTFGYVTDETVVVNDALEVAPYPKPLSLVGEDDNHPGKTQKSPDELRLGSCPDRLHLGGMVVLERHADVTAPRIDSIGLIDAMLDVIPQTSGLPSLPRPLQRLAEALDAGGGAHRLTYSEIAEAEPLLVELMSRPIEASPETWVAVAPGATTVPLRDGRLGLDAYQDAIQVADEVLLLVGGVPMRLAGIGATIWLALRSGVTADGLLDHVTAVHGDHPQAAELVDQAVVDLTAAGAVARRVPQTLADVMAGRSSDTAVGFA